jgi:hypothetical protein
MHKIVAAFLVVLAIAGCQKKPEVTTRVGKDFKVDKLFTHEGCTVFRFGDGGHNVYYTNCSGETMSTVFCGKGCVRPRNVKTVRQEF